MGTSKPKPTNESSSFPPTDQSNGLMSLGENDQSVSLSQIQPITGKTAGGPGMPTVDRSNKPKPSSKSQSVTSRSSGLTSDLSMENLKSKSLSEKQSGFTSFSLDDFGSGGSTAPPSGQTSTLYPSVSSVSKGNNSVIKGDNSQYNGGTKSNTNSVNDSNFDTKTSSELGP